MEHVSKYVDLSHKIQSGMTTYPGLPAPIISDYMTRKESRSHYTSGTEFHIGRIEMVANTGTYIDSPYHRYKGGKDISNWEISKIADLKGIVVEYEEENAKGIGSEVFSGLKLSGKAVLIYTNFDRFWGTEDYFQNHPYLTKEATEYLIDSNVALVGIDSVNIDSMEDRSRPAHSKLLKADIPIVEHLTNLHSLVGKDFRFFAVPPRIEGLGTFPVRAFAIIE